LRKINNGEVFNDVNWLKKTKDIIEMLDSLYKNKSTLLQFYSAIVSILKTSRIVKIGVRPLKAYDKVYKKLYIEININNNTNSLIPTEKQRESHMEWNDIIIKYNNYSENVIENIGNLKNLTSQQYNSILTLMVWSLYVLIPPRRSLDYSSMIIHKKLYVPSGKIENVYCIKSQKFYFNQYKTQKSFGLFVFDIPVQLQKIIKIYLRYINYKTGSPFLIVNGKGFVENSITRILAKIDMGINMMRHSFITSQFGKTLEERTRISQIMGHDLRTQEAYIKNF
jgi:hypothetical protein